MKIGVLSIYFIQALDGVPCWIIGDVIAGKSITVLYSILLC